MARGEKQQQVEQRGEQNEERKRLKRLALSNRILSDAPAKAAGCGLTPSNTVLKHHGKDILRKSQRKNRYLFSFPGLLAPVTGGKIGELKDLFTKNPILYLDFPQGQMKLFGTIVYPRNRYLTLQFSRGGKNVMCEDCFDTMIVFSDAWWIGRKEENPEELHLDFPKDLNLGQITDLDFKGGAGGICEVKQSVNLSEMKSVQQESPNIELEDDISESQNSLKDLTVVTPSRRSSRTADRKFNFAETSSGDDVEDNNSDILEGEEKNFNVDGSEKTKNTNRVLFDIDDEDASIQTEFLEHNKQSLASSRKNKISGGDHGSLIQATISTLFKKVEEKEDPKNKTDSFPSKASSQNLEHIESKRKTEVEDRGSRKRRKIVEKINAGIESTSKKKQTEINRRKKKSVALSSASGPKKRQTVPANSSQVEEDDIEELSNTSQDDASDEDWAA